MILCCGEALIDMIPEQTVSGRSGFVPHSGGAIFNTAVALGRLQQPAGMLTGLSTDPFGTHLRAGLDAAGVDTTHLILSDRPTTLAFVALKDGHARYDFHDENSAGRMVQIADMPAIAPQVSALCFGGISLACEPGADAYASLLSREGAARAVMIDLNIRPDFIRDADRYRARLDAMMSAADILKTSDDDLNWLLPGPQPLHDKVLHLRDLGPALVILTQGRNGATGFLPGADPVHVAAETARVVDTVGAGDTFNAGVLCHLSRQGLLHKDRLRSLTSPDTTEALKFGAKVAAITVSRSGANPPWAHEL